MRIAFLLIVLLAAGCATRPAASAYVHPEFASRRPATVALEVDGPNARAVGEAVYAALIARNYTVLAPGEPPGPVMGVARVVVGPGSAELTIVDAGNTVVYRSSATADTPEKLAARLAADLPPK